MSWTTPLSTTSSVAWARCSLEILWANVPVTRLSVRLDFTDSNIFFSDSRELSRTKSSTPQMARFTLCLLDWYCQEIIPSRRAKVFFRAWSSGAESYASVSFSMHVPRFAENPFNQESDTPQCASAWLAPNHELLSTERRSDSTTSPTPCSQKLFPPLQVVLMPALLRHISISSSMPLVRAKTAHSPIGCSALRNSAIAFPSSGRVG